ncbi:hypothetical protein CLAFUW4_12969 [Fulvia fulva]|uniref:Uncharacterized protein n=1 Tax=Passalora fulva TaxID=5499 RepID=A0A9Q8PK34_PASFU|nr:uncharacterized protein CLAFUR5_12832 [Fulvia fulva]KAK4612134.1 hypothetical protein CLAFUR4_12973 [Fulvia fulva]UJO23928.1 hypothetical protein CLAFUR5_12832 [Fulvia fulva]WPV21578.1 hypothetical protein CLAFUW4_12969 [Fulvia fulva]WPV36338.1 hypothetical protein CLAFUW7_12976 [Fulvia fulva]
MAMALAAHYDSGSDDEFHSVSGRDEHDDSESTLNMPPVHPIAPLQGAFEESIYESTQNEDDSAAESPYDAEMRRRELLDATRYEDVRQNKWKQKHGAKYHPLLKLMAQIVFGMHLLQQSQAKSNEEVVKILQNHVTDVDSFLERTSEDFVLATNDIEERIRYLKLPMQHMEVFNVMLDEKKFRADLVNGNDKIEMIVGRTAKAVNDALFDISSGLESTKELGTYLSKVIDEGLPSDTEIADVFAAMRGNEQGWMKYLQELRIKGENLGNSLVALGNVIADINKHAAAASRRNKPQSRTISTTTTTGSSSPALRSKFAKDSVVYRKPGPWLDKPLPSEPDSEFSAAKVSMPKPHPVPFATRYEQPREHAPIPGSRSSNAGDATPSQRRATSRTASGPLSSNPPDAPPDASPRVPYKNPGRSQSQSTAHVLRPSSPQRPVASFRRSRSQGAILDSQTPNKVIPRKPVAGTLRKHPGTQIKYVPPTGVTPAKEYTSITNGFSRRIFMKLRNIPPLPQSRQRTEAVARPVDSAYSSDRKRSTSSPTEFTMDTEHDIEKESQSYFEKDAVAGAGDAIASTRLGLFPKDTGPLAPSQASMRSRHDMPNSKAVSSAWTDRSLTTTHSSKAFRTMSIRKFFGHHKDESRNLPAQ